MESNDVLYAALLARDARFDGRFLVGVTSTGIYCRPVCRVRHPKQANCRFFSHAAAAEAAGFRPCRRCRPELAPPQARFSGVTALASAAAAQIEAGRVGEGGLPSLAARLGISARQMRRIFHEAFGVSPVAYLQTHRLLLAKRLLTDTDLPVTAVALAAGFGSLRRFNELFGSQYRLTPSSLRRESSAREGGEIRAPTPPEAGFHFALAYRPPFDWPRLCAFLAARTIAGVETVADDCYRRSVRIFKEHKSYQGWLEISAAPTQAHLLARLSRDLLPALPQVLAGVRRICDLACEPAAVLEVLGPLAAEAPGMRLPGAFDGFEMSVRAILGQQVSVRAAHTLAGRLAARFGAACSTPWVEIQRLFPRAEELAAVDAGELSALGIVPQRARAIIALAQAVAAGTIELEPTAEIESTLSKLQNLPGIGPWTAQYIALRALSWPDAWPSGDLALCKALGGVSRSAADTLAQAWRPWRGYAALHLWRRLSETR